MKDESRDILTQSIVRNATALLSVPHGKELRHIKSRFLSEDAQGIWMESMPHHGQVMDRAIEAGQSAGVSFKGGVNKIVFAAPLLKRTTEYRLNSSTTLHAVLLAQPTNVEAVQRRGNYRVKIRPEMHLSVRLWRLAEKADVRVEPLPEEVVPTELRDISVGGIGVMLLPHNGRPPRVAPQERLRIELMTAHGPLLLPGELRYPPTMPTASEPVRAGLAFTPDENDFTARQTVATLTRVVGELQREELRRYRMGLMLQSDTPEPAGA